MPTVTRYSCLRAVTWLRQKTRTASSPAEANGDWTDVAIVEMLNLATIEIVNQMLMVPWCPYFLRDEFNITTASGKAVVGLGNGDIFGVIKLASVRVNAAGPVASAGKFLKPMSHNRLIHTATQANPDGLLKISDGRLFYVVRQEGSMLNPTSVSLTVQLFNNNTELPLDFEYYAYPFPLPVPALDTDFVGLPVMAIPALLALTLSLMAEDAGDAVLYQWASQQYGTAIEAVRAAMHQNHDMPDTLAAGVQTDNT